jgi:NTP pyrophosphatase (non-canonical NTP hydrolase)
MNSTEHLLTCLAEECAEVGQRVSKALRFGLEEIQPGQSFTNAQRIAQEFHDVLAVIEMLEDIGVLDRSGDVHAIERKKSKVLAYMDYARDCGTLAAKDTVQA